jgi:hypothetical protein
MNLNTNILALVGKANKKGVYLQEANTIVFWKISFTTNIHSNNTSNLLQCLSMGSSQKAKKVVSTKYQ